MANTFQLIQSITVTGSAADIQFTNVPQTYTDLCVVASVAGRLTSGSFGALVIYTAASQSSALSNWRNLRGSNTTVSSSNAAYPIIGELQYISDPIFSSVHIYIPGYTTNTNKQVIMSDSAALLNSNTGVMSFNAEIIDSTNTIGFVGLGDGSAGGGLRVGSMASLYGIKNT